MNRPTSKSRRLLHLLVKQRWQCPLCGEPILRATDANLDHRFPRSRGGSSALHNLQAAHKECNSKKGNGLDHAVEIQRRRICHLPRYSLPVDLLWNVRCDICCGPADPVSVHKDAVWLQCRYCKEITRQFVSAAIRARENVQTADI